MNSNQEITRLTRGDQRRVEDWILSHRDDITKNRMTKSEVAARIKKELGIKVTPHNVHGAAKTIGVSFYLSRGRNGGVKNDRYQALLEFVCLLAETLGEPIPESLRPKHDQNGSH